jgi:hypothetical protein
MAAARGSIEQRASARLGWRGACRSAALVIIKAKGMTARCGRLGRRSQRGRSAIEGWMQRSRTAAQQEQQQDGRQAAIVPQQEAAE